MKAAIKAIEIYSPETVLTNEDLVKGGRGWTAQKIFEKTGIKERRVASAAECASALGVAAANNLFTSGACDKASIDYLLFCTQSPDFFLPTTACLIHERLGLKGSCGALDFNLGCSGYVYGLSLAKALVESKQASNVLLITAETYSKFIHPEDSSVRTLFGDAGAATVISGVNSSDDFIGPFIFGTDGGGGRHLIVPTGGMRQRRVSDAEIMSDTDGNRRTINNLFMDGPEIFNFTLRVVPETVENLLAKAGKTLDEVDFFVFHQANAFMLQHLRRKLKIAEEKFVVAIENHGNTVSSTIPIALKHLMMRDKLKPEKLLVLIGFGVGYSWGGVLVKWSS